MGTWARNNTWKHIKIGPEADDILVEPPSGKITITENGTDIDVSTYATADVAVDGGGGGADIPTFTVTYDGNGDFVSITCDKTFAECCEIFNTSSEAGLIIYDYSDGNDPYTTPVMAVEPTYENDEIVSILWYIGNMDGIVSYSFTQTAETISEPETINIGMPIVPITVTNTYADGTVAYIDYEISQYQVYGGVLITAQSPYLGGQLYAIDYEGMYAIHITNAYDTNQNHLIMSSITASGELEPLQDQSNTFVVNGTGSLAITWRKSGD